MIVIAKVFATRSVCNKQRASAPDFRCLSRDLCRRQSDAVSVAIEKDTGSLTRGALVRLNPLARPHRCPHTFHESKTASCCVAAIVTAHDRFDGFSGLVGVVEGDGADVVMEDMGFDDTVQELAADKAEFTINGCCCATGIVPACGSVMRETGIGVLEEGDGNCVNVSIGSLSQRMQGTYRASG